MEIDASLPRSQWGKKREAQQEDGGMGSPVPGASIERDFARKGEDGEGGEGKDKERDNGEEENKDEKTEEKKNDKKPRKERLADAVLTAATAGY